MDVEVEDGLAVHNNCVYIIPPGRDMAFLNGALQLLEPSKPHGRRLPIDFFFRSLAQDQHERAIGIVLLAALAVALMRVRRGRKRPERIPANMASYRVEFDDTVMTISNRYGVNWQDLVKTNRLKPPYELKPGRRLLIPRHPLARRPETNKTL